MSDELIISLWCQLAFRPKLTESELELLDKCAKRLLELIGFKHGWYSIRRYLFAPRTNRWVFWESFSIKTKTGIFLYILDKDPNVDLDSFINFEGM